MHMSSTFDPAKDAENRRKHGVSLADGDGVLSDSLALTIEDDSAEGEQRFVTVGLNSLGTLMVVVFTDRDGDPRLISVGKATPRERRIVQNKGKTRITIFLDDAVLRQFRALSQSTGKGYQTLINEALNAHLGLGGEPMTPELVRRIVREELASES